MTTKNYLVLAVLLLGLLLIAAGISYLAPGARGTANQQPAATSTPAVASEAAQGSNRIAKTLAAYGKEVKFDVGSYGLVYNSFSNGILLFSKKEYAIEFAQKNSDHDVQGVLALCKAKEADGYIPNDSHLKILEVDGSLRKVQLIDDPGNNIWNCEGVHGTGVGWMSVDFIVAPH